MFKTIRILAAAGLLAASALAQAATYEFSYNFLNGNVVTGTFDGIANGNLVTDWTHVSVSVNGGVFPDKLFVADIDGTGGAVASFNGLENNFLVISPDGNHALLGGAFLGTNTNGITYLTPDEHWGEGDSNSPYSGSRWHLSLVVAAVPEPETYAMLLGGLAMLGALARRSKPRV
jgi:hypothetical protein